VWGATMDRQQRQNTTVNTGDKSRRKGMPVWRRRLDGNHTWHCTRPLDTNFDPPNVESGRNSLSPRTRSSGNILQERYTLREQQGSGHLTGLPERRLLSWDSCGWDSRIRLQKKCIVPPPLSTTRRRHLLMITESCLHLLLRR